MKYFIYLLLVFFSITLYAKDFTFKSMGKTVRNEVTKFPDGSKFISFRHEGGFETDVAKYGIYKCHGSILYNRVLIKSKILKLIFLIKNCKIMM